MFQLGHLLSRTLSPENIGVLFWFFTSFSSFMVHITYEVAIHSMQEQMLGKIQNGAYSWGEYEVIPSYQQGPTSTQAKFTKRTFDVTLVTQCSVNNLHYVIETLQRWKGPISIAIFAPQDYFVNAAFGAKELVECHKDRDLTINLVYPRQYSPEFSEKEMEIWSNYYETKDLTSRCDQLLDTLRSITGSNYALGDIAYPHNTLRNVAKRSVTSTHVFLLDVDVMPSANIRESFLKNIMLTSASSGSAQNQNNKKVFITPVFEIEKETKMPVTKAELKLPILRNESRVFHIETCPVCHKPTRNNEWLAIEDNKRFIAFEVDWSPAWEPFYISSADVPDYNERFKQYGYDRISQNCELYVAGYSFHVLANSFVVHRGMKRPGEFHEMKNEENKRNFKIFNEVNNQQKH